MTLTAWKQGFKDVIYSVDSLLNYHIYEAFKNKASVVRGLRNKMTENGERRFVGGRWMQHVDLTIVGILLATSGVSFWSICRMN